MGDEAMERMMQSLGWSQQKIARIFIFLVLAEVHSVTMSMLRERIYIRIVIV
jgi:hypothetical protein